MAVIIDDIKGNNISQIIMSDDGTGTGINIPSMIISYEDGKILKDFLKDHADDDLGVKAALVAQFIMYNPDDRVEWDLWYTSANDKSMDFINYFREDAAKLGDHALFTPYIVTWSCTYCEDEFKNKECVSGGKYCAIMHGDSKYINGKDII